MFTLIKREIEDHIAYFLAAVLFSAIFIAIAVSLTYNEDREGPSPAALALLIPTIIVAVFGFCAMGASQMYIDRTRKISSLLSTLPVTRGQILIARIITAVLAMLVLLLPLAVTAAILLRLFPPPYPIYPHYVAEIFTAIFLMGFACYCLGLQLGFSSGKVAPTLGALVLTIILVPLIIIKGFWGHTVIILLLLIFASLTRTWQKFTSTSL